MFENWHIRRNILGIVGHVVTHPDAVQRVLQTNAANYAKPDIVKRVIAPMIGRGLLSSDEDLWREQRRIVAASRSEEHTSELQSLMRISYAVFCLKKKTKITHHVENKKPRLKNNQHSEEL